MTTAAAYAIAIIEYRRDPTPERLAYIRELGERLMMERAHE
jgi:hypothetical protein